MGFGHLENLGPCPDCHPDTTRAQYWAEHADTPSERAVWRACHDLAYPDALAERIIAAIPRTTATKNGDVIEVAMPLPGVLEPTGCRAAGQLWLWHQTDPDVRRVLDTALAGYRAECHQAGCQGCRTRIGEPHAVCCPWSLQPGAAVTELDTEHDPWPAGAREAGIRAVRAFTGYARAVAAACADLGVAACPEDGQVQHAPAWVSLAVASQRSEVAWDDQSHESEFVWGIEVGWHYFHVDQTGMDWRFLNAGLVPAPRDVAAAIVDVLAGRAAWAPSGHETTEPGLTRHALLEALEHATAAVPIAASDHHERTSA